jgi:hypothetical protein
MLASNAVERVCRVPWLSRVGASELLAVPDWTTEQVVGVRAAETALDEDWQRIMEAATGDLQAFLFGQARSEHQRWNEYVAAANKVLRENVMPAAGAALAAAGLTGRSESILRWQMRTCLIELTLQGIGVPEFFVKVLGIYEGGHLPCGWQGRLPDSLNGDQGRAAVFIRSGRILYW